MGIFTNTILIIKSSYIFILEYSKYKLNITNEEIFIDNVTTRLSRQNMLYIKILQWITTDTIYNNENIKKKFEQFSNNVDYSANDIDYDCLHRLSDKNNIKLDSLIPINSGTISIVFKGMLDDKRIIIKMKKKNIHKKLVESVNFFNLLGKISSYIPYLSDLNLKKIIQSNSENLLLQTNFLKEVENIETFYNIYKDNTNTIIPYVYKNFTLENDNIIVMEFIEGSTIYSIHDSVKDNYSDLVFKFMFDCIFKYDIFHGDLHPGNILFMYNIEDNIYNIGLIDFGIIIRIEKEYKNYIFQFFDKVLKQDHYKLFNFIINKLVLKIDPLNNEIVDNKIIIEELLYFQKKYNLFDLSMIKPPDIYYLSVVLKKYNLILDVKFSKILVCISSMYSLLYMLQDGSGKLIFEIAFNKYCIENIPEKKMYDSLFGNRIRGKM